MDIEQRIGSFDHDPFIVSVPPKEENKAADDVQDIIKQIHNRKGYSNPTRSVDSEEDKSEEVVMKNVHLTKTENPTEVHKCFRSHEDLEGVY